MLRAALFSSLVLVAPAALAQDVRTQVIEAVRAQGCAMDETEAEQIFGGMGLDRAAVGAAVQEMIAAGEAYASPEGDRIMLSPALCAAPPGDATGAVAAAAWIEAELRQAPGCRLPLTEFAGHAGAAEIAPEAFDQAILDLVATGAAAFEAGEIVAAVCDPTALPSDVEIVEGYRGPGFRAIVALRVMSGGCRVPAEGREAWMEAMVAEAVGRLPFGGAPSAEALAAVRAGIEEVLDNPGPAYETEEGTGDLVMVQCQP